MQKNLICPNQDDADGGASISRPFTSSNNGLGELWTPIIPSCNAVVEADIPPGVDVDELDLELTSVNVGYRGFGTVPENERPGLGSKRRELSGSCNVDVVCSEPDGDTCDGNNDCSLIDGWRKEIPSVAVYHTGGSLFCTGSMIRSSAEDDFTPYFLTAAHCGLDADNAASLVTYWNYETSTCGGTPDGQLNYFMTGADHLVSYSASDVTLLKLHEPIDVQWLIDGIISLAGWDRRDIDATSAVAIHHPSCDEKRIR